MMEVDLAVLQCIERRRSSEEKYPGRKPSRSGQGREMTIAGLAVELVRTELLLRARGGTLCVARTPAWLADRRARMAGLRRWRDGEVESALIWLCVRGLAECSGEDVYAWTSNATDERLRRVLL